MESALPQSFIKPTTSGALIKLRHGLAFMMLGGASIIVMIVFGLLTVRQIVMDMHVRVLLQQSTGLILAFLLTLSYPHFIWSFRFAYQQGTRFIGKNAAPLLGYPLTVVLLLAACLATWGRPVADFPLLIGTESVLQRVGIGVYWSQYDGVGQVLLATLLIGQIVMAGHHYCMQAFGVSLTCAEDKGCRLAPKQKQILRANLYALWAMNFFSGFSFFALLNSRGFTYHPFTFPVALQIVSYAVFAITLAAVLLLVAVPLWRENKGLPPLAVVPILSVLLWLQPFWQPYGYQLWVVPIAHGAQYLYFALRVEGHNFGAPEIKSGAAKTLYLIGLSAVIGIVGYLGFVYVPLFLESKQVLTQFTPNFCMIAIFILISTHHYVVDAVVWRPNSRSKQLLHEATVRPTGPSY